MHFKKLELVGFKSFSEKTVLDFEPGITAVVGPNGCGKCLIGSSEVCLADGSRIKISAAVELALKNAERVEKIEDGFIAYWDSTKLSVLSLNPQTLKIEPKPVYAFVKRKAPEYLLRIKTKSGREVVTTHYHPFFSIKNGQIFNLKAEELKIGIKIATVSNLETIISDNSSRLFNPSQKSPGFSPRDEYNLLSVRDESPGFSPGRFNNSNMLNLSFRDNVEPKIAVIEEEGISDIYWDGIAKITKVSSPEWVYDLSVLGTHNFVAQDIIVHNSNIFDSIRWVLGEQSAKSLRGSEMQDVIFNGTDQKEPLGMAEVTLTFDNSAGFFSLDHPEVAITRRLFRSGESEYLLNKTPVRLKDILDLLLGTGIGAESYSIVAQGKIDLVLSSRPEDRRLVFDEASGITKYKTQKRESLRKLEETEQNLLRVSDIVAEVKRQIGSLERQANKARRYKEIFEELKSKEIELSLIEKGEFLKAKEAVILELSGLEKAEAELLGIIREIEARMSGRSAQLRGLEEAIMGLRNEILQQENLIVRGNEQIKFNQQVAQELSGNCEYLKVQAEQAQNKLITGEEKLKNAQNEFLSIEKNKEEKSRALKEKEVQIAALAESIKRSLHNISSSKGLILELASQIAQAKNEVSEFSAQQQVFLARQKRLGIEKAKVSQERLIAGEALNNMTQEVDSLKGEIAALGKGLGGLKAALQSENAFLSDICAGIGKIEKERLSLSSHKEFLEELKSKYNDIGEAMNAVIFLDRLPQEQLSGMVIKVKDQARLSLADNPGVSGVNFKLTGEAKAVQLDTSRLEEKLRQLEQEEAALRIKKEDKEASLNDLNAKINLLQEEARSHELTLANKETSRASFQEQFNKIKEEEDLIVMELQEVEREVSVLAKNLETGQSRLNHLNKEQSQAEGLISEEEGNIASQSSLREAVLVAITQTKAELEALARRTVSDEATLKILQDTCRHNEENLKNLENQMAANAQKKLSLEAQIKDCQAQIQSASQQIEIKQAQLKENEEEYRRISAGAGDEIKKIEQDRQKLDGLKDKLYELQMQNKDLDYQYATVKERILQAYKVDLEAMTITPQEIGKTGLCREIETLKQKLDSLGTVNLVAIEEYDELKKRYDFLNQQQNDLLNAKEQLHQAILKINRTTKQMFLETFEKVKAEFRNYFRLLFNGGDAQVFLIDEQDPLESGIEIICRPPGKKLQNVLLLSGGEKSLSAIALIFAIFKVKPSPFCVLDEIDAALDEANVERFAKVLQEFTKQSQFIVITHNKRTIANADIMYGITMQESGVSKIVSVKFAKEAIKKDKEPDLATEPA